MLKPLCDPRLTKLEELGPLFCLTKHLNPLASFTNLKSSPTVSDAVPFLDIHHYN